MPIAGRRGGAAAGGWWSRAAWWFLLAVLAVATLQLFVRPAILYGLVIVLALAAVVLARPVVMMVLGGVALIVGLGAAVAVGTVHDGGFAARYAWFALFCALAVGIAELERRRLRRLEEASNLLIDIVAATSQEVFAKQYVGRDAESGRYVLVNDAWSRNAGLEPGEGIGLTDRDVRDEAFAAQLRSDDLKIMETRTPVTIQEEVVTEDGARTYLVSKFPLFDNRDRVWGVGGIATDVSDIREAESRLAAVFAHSPVPTMRVVSRGRGATSVVDANEAMLRLLGRDPVGFNSEQLVTLVHPEDREDAASVVLGFTGTDTSPVVEVSSREIRLLSVSGNEVWVVLHVSAVALPGERAEKELIVQFDDITARKQAEDTMTRRALTDSVTLLPNRYALVDRLGIALQRLRRHPGAVCVLFCDLDRFKQVNDAFGHGAGDQLLADVGRRLTGALRPEDTVGRLGGDEFVVICEEVDDATEAAMIALRMQDRLREAWTYQGHQFSPTVSIGIASTTDPYADPGELLRQADVAMYRAKDSGRDRIETYDRSLDDELAEALSVQQRLRSALDGDGLVLHYQPMVQLVDRAVDGVEALVRMRNPDGTLLGPDAFLPHAEASGLIEAVGSWVLGRALTDLQLWRSEGQELTMAVNVSPTQLSRPGFSRHVLDAVAAHQVDPAWLVVEVTETALISDNAAVVASLRELGAAGVSIALDDFGTGYSSLSWLHEFPVDVVKIDRSFVRTLGTDHRRAVLVRALLDIAAETGLDVVAEGVETEFERAALLAMGCRRAQGWLFGKAVPFDDPSWATLSRASAG